MTDHIEIDIEEKLIEQILFIFVQTLSKESVEVYTEELNNNPDVYNAVGKAVFNEEILKAIKIVIDKNE